MGEKSRPGHMTKKPGRSVKEKRLAKHETHRPSAPPTPVEHLTHKA